MAYRDGFGFGFGITPWVQRLLIANGVVFLLQMLMPMITLHLQFVPALVLTRPWAIITYMFAHGGFFHLFFNMLVLFFFGPPLEARWGSAEFLKFYIVCGVGAAALSFLLAPHAAIIGASGAIYGIMLAFAMYWPDSQIYIWGILPVKAKYLVGFLAIFSLFSMIGGSGGNIAHAAHLGGFAAAFVYLRVRSPGGMFGGMRKMMNRRKLRVVPDDKPPPPAPRTGPPPSRRRPGASADEEKLLDELDRVLEKISTQGMSSLTAQERRLLDEVSKRYRTD